MDVKSWRCQYAVCFTDSISIINVQWERNTSARPRRPDPSGYVTKVIHIQMMELKPEFLKKNGLKIDSLSISRMIS
jgi:hypothetical protein